MDQSDQRGLYRPSDEHDACGVGFVANIKGARSHQIVRSALDLLINLEHRGACGSDPDTGDGAGILIQMPDRFLRKTRAVRAPPAGAYGAGLVFLPHDTGGARRTARRSSNASSRKRARRSSAGANYRQSVEYRSRVRPSVRRSSNRYSSDAGDFRSPTSALFERKLYVIRKLHRAAAC